MIQGIGRLDCGLPLPLLELHTIMHVLCAVSMYWFWWDKPLDVRYPIILDLQQLAEEIYSSLKVRDDDRPLPPESPPEPRGMQTVFSEITVEHPQDSGRDKTSRQAPLTHTENDGSAIRKATIRPTCLHIYRLENNGVSSRFRRVW